MNDNTLEPGVCIGRLQSWDLRREDEAASRTCKNFATQSHRDANTILLFACCGFPCWFVWTCTNMCYSQFQSIIIHHFPLSLITILGCPLFFWPMVFFRHISNVSPLFCLSDARLLPWFSFRLRFFFSGILAWAILSLYGKQFHLAFGSCMQRLVCFLNGLPLASQQLLKFYW